MCDDWKILNATGQVLRPRCGRARHHVEPEGFERFRCCPYFPHRRRHRLAESSQRQHCVLGVDWRRSCGCSGSINAPLSLFYRPLTERIPVGVSGHERAFCLSPVTSLTRLPSLTDAGHACRLACHALNNGTCWYLKIQGQIYVPTDCDRRT